MAGKSDFIKALEENFEEICKSSGFQYKNKISNDEQFKELLKIPNINFIPTSVFAEGYKLKDIDLGNALDTIAQDAFADTCIETLVLPKTLRVVKTNAFNGMSQLTKLVFEGVPDFIEKNAIIQNEPHKMIIEVPWTREFEQEKIKKKDWQRGWVADRRNCKVVYKG